MKQKVKRGHAVCRVLANGDPEGRIFCIYPVHVHHLFCPAFNFAVNNIQN